MVRRESVQREVVNRLSVDFRTTGGNAKALLGCCVVSAVVLI